MTAIIECDREHHLVFTLTKMGKLVTVLSQSNKFPRQACVYHVCKDSSNARLCLVAFVHFVSLLLQGQKVL